MTSKFLNYLSVSHKPYELLNSTTPITTDVECADCQMRNKTDILKWNPFFPTSFLCSFLTAINRSPNHRPSNTGVFPLAKSGPLKSICGPRISFYKQINYI